MISEMAEITHDNLAATETVEVFGPELMLPSQYFAMVRQTAHIDDGVRRLMLAVLELAINDWQQSAQAIDALNVPSRRARLYRESNEWLFGESGDGPFSFANICAALGIDAEFLRRGLKAWRERGTRLPRHSPVISDDSISRPTSGGRYATGGLHHHRTARSMPLTVNHSAVGLRKRRLCDY